MTKQLLRPEAEPRHGSRIALFAALHIRTSSLKVRKAKCSYDRTKKLSDESRSQAQKTLFNSRILTHGSADQPLSHFVTFSVEAGSVISESNDNDHSLVLSFNGR